MKRTLTLAMAVCLVTPLFSQLPKTLNFQGYLTNDAGEPITTESGNPLDVSFSLYTARTGGSLVWGPEVHEIAVDKGIFNAILGASTITAVPLDFGGSLTFDNAYFLQITINPGTAEEELLSRLELSAGMYSLSTLNASNITSGTLSGSLLDAVDASILTGSVAITNGGTGATTAVDARTSLGVAIGSDVQAYDADLDDLADGTLSGSKVGSGIAVGNLSGSVAIANGGTGATTAEDARISLGVDIGSEVQAYDAGLSTIAGLTTTANQILYTTDDDTYGATDISNLGLSLIAIENGTTLRSELGLAIDEDVQAHDDDLDTYASITPSANVQTMLGSVNNFAIRSNIGLAIGTNVQAQDDDLNTYAGITPSADIQTLLGSANNTEIRSNIGLGTMAGEDTDDVTITGGSISGGIIGTGINASNITDGTLPNARLDEDLQDLADGTLSDARLESTVDVTRLNTSGGLHVGGTSDPGTDNLIVDGYTTLGDDAAPAIKMKTLTGTSGAIEGAIVQITHGLTLSSIISVSVILDVSTTQRIHPSYTANAGFEFNWFLDADEIQIVNSPTNSENILSKNLKIVITYETL